MSDPMKQAWSDVEERLSTLRQMMKDRYQGAAEGERESDATVGGEQDPGAALKNAFDRLVTAVGEFGDRAADVARDDDVKAQARQAVASLNDALSATVNMISEQIGGLFKRADKRASVPADSTADPPAEAPGDDATKTHAPQSDPDAAGTYVDDEDTPEPREPNEPA